MVINIDSMGIVICFVTYWLGWWGYHKFFMKTSDQNTISTLVDQMSEKRPLPITVEEFEKWSDNIITGSCIPKDPNVDEEVHRDSLKFALATMLMHLSPTSDHECDGYFMKSTRKGAINQVADFKMKQLRDKAKARLAAEESTKGSVTAATTTEAVTDAKEPAVL